VRHKNSKNTIRMHISQYMFLGALVTMPLLNRAHAAGPVVNLIRPTNGASYAAGTPILMSATATASNATLASLDFVAGTNLLRRFAGPLTNGTYDFSWTNVPAGMYQVYAQATDDAGGQGVSALVQVSVTTLTNVRPTLDPLPNLAISENAGSQTVALSGIGSGATNENQALTITAFSSNPILIPTPSINYTSPDAHGRLVFTPVANAFGTATITVLVDDGQSVSNIVARSFNVMVAPTNVRPTLDPLANLAISEDAGSQMVVLSGIGPGAAGENQTLSITALSSNPDLIPNPIVTYISPNSRGTLTFAPVADRFGVAIISVTVNDGPVAGSTITRSFLVNVSPVNDAPTLDSLANIAVNENAGNQTVALSGIGPGAVGENQTLSITALSSNPDLIPNPIVTYISPNSRGTLTFTPVANAFGMATIIVIVDDGQAVSNIVTRAFNVIVAPTGPLPILGMLVMSPEGGAKFTVYGHPGLTHIVECSPDTVSWTAIGQGVMPPQGSMSISDASASTSDNRFYRVIELP
jgi:hypothetical protein